MEKPCRERNYQQGLLASTLAGGPYRRNIRATYDPNTFAKTSRSGEIENRVPCGGAHHEDGHARRDQ